MLEYTDFTADKLKQIPNDSILQILYSMAENIAYCGNLENFIYYVDNLQEIEINLIIDKLTELGYSCKLLYNADYPMLEINYV